MIDPLALKAQVDGMVARQKTVWNDDQDRDADPMAWARTKQVVEAVELELPGWPAQPGGDPPEVEETPAIADPEIVTRLDAIDANLAALAQAVRAGRAPRDPATFPGWLQDAAGDPESYDAPEALRTSVKVRVLPTLYARLEQTRARFGFQTLTGTWECLLRLGLAAAERMPVRDGRT